jgi:fatty-acyl-CoA synthase
MHNPVHAGITIGGQALRALRRYPGRTAFSWDGGQLSYAATADLVGRMQQVFDGLGLQQPLRVAVLSGNRAQSWCATLAAQLMGAATTALHPKASLADHLYQLNDCKADLLIVDARRFRERGGELAESGSWQVLTLGMAGYGQDLLAAAEAVGSAAACDRAEAGQVAAFSYTGGTTGKAKCIVRTHATLLAASSAILADFELPSRPRFLAVSPISHVGGTKILPTLLRGGTVHLVDGFDPELVMRAIERERINCTLMVPTMVYTLLDHPQLSAADLSSLELLLYGASPMSPARLLEGIERIGPVFAQFYGQTECYPIAVLPRADHDPACPRQFSACGYPVTGSEVALLDIEGNPVARGQVGEICVRGPHVMVEYAGQAAATAEALAGGWLHTGDLGQADECGRLYIVDRLKDMIVTGGFNVFTREVEDVLTANPDVVSAAVFGIPDEKWGEAVTAFVVRRPGSAITEAALVAAVKQCKGATHAPKRLEFVEELPTTSLGKINKKALRDRFWPTHNRKVG